MLWTEPGAVTHALLKRCRPPVNNRIFFKSKLGIGAEKASLVSFFTEISMSIFENSCSLEFPWLNNNKKLRQIKNTGFLKNFLLLVVFNLIFSSN